jgi:hypothetical protein
VLAVGPLGLNIAGNSVGLRVTTTGDLEGDIRGSLGLDLKRGAMEVIVLSKEVVGGLSKIL